MVIGSSYLRDKSVIARFPGKLIDKGKRRKLICFILLLNFLILPTPQLAHDMPMITTSALGFTKKTIRNSFSAFTLLFGAPDVQDTDETLQDRLAQVANIHITPSKFVGYEGQSLTFSAIGANFADKIVQGVVFTWESSDTSKLQIDDSGRATFLSSGLTSITCRAGAATSSARVLIKSGSQPRQSDSEWKADQDSLPETESGIVGNLLPSLLDKLMPTAHAQSGGYAGSDFGYDELWSEPHNLTGSPGNRAVEPAALGPVLPEGSNFNFTVPLISLGGRGIGTSLALYYNSRVWTRHGSAVTFSAVGGSPFAGFSLDFGRILTYGTSSNTTYVLIDPDGTRHYLGTGNSAVTTTYRTTDGSNIIFVNSAPISVNSALYYPDGTKVNVQTVNNRLLPSRITDSNGNYIQIAYKTGAASPLAIDFVTDTQGRKIQFNYDASGYLISITAPGYGGTAQTPVTRTIAQFDYQSRTLSYTFSGLTVENAPTGAVNVLRHIYFPATNTGSLFTYSDYGMIYNVSNRRQMTIDGNGVISDGVESASVEFNYPTSGTTQLTDAPAFTQRTESATGSPTGTYTYSTSTNSLAQTKTITVTRPDSSTLNLTRSTNASSTADGLVVQSEVKNDTGLSMAKSVIAYANDPGGAKQVQSAINYDDTNAATKVDFDYDQYGNITNKRDYGFPIGGLWQVRRRINYTYSTDANYITRYLRSLVTEVNAYDALENTSDADDVLIAKTALVYDDYTATGGMEGYTGLPKPPGHNSAAYSTSFTYRGNVTGTTQWIDIAANTKLPTRLKKYDIFGNVLQEQLSCCKQKTFTYVQDDYWANPPTVTSGDPAGLHLTGSTTYDFNTGLAKYTEYANMGKRWFYYDGALRMTRQELPTGASETASYNDAAMTATSTRTGLGTSTMTYDGFGRMTQVVDANNGQVNTSYDAMGRVVSQTNPFTAGGTPGTATAYQYDSLSRVTVVTLPDNQTTQNVYSGNTITLIDQTNRKIERETDGLGRLAKVTEQDASGNLSQETTYGYNLIDKLTLVNQGNQTRSFKYDALGRLLYEKIPEQTATINDGTGTYWTMKYTYTTFGAVATKTDARGVVSTYNYDQMNRLTWIVHNTGNAPGVASGAGAGYTYDNNSSSPTNGLLLSAGNESYTYDSYRRLASITRTIDSINYTTKYQYRAGDIRSRITYPSTRVVNINRGSTGRLLSLTDEAGANYLSGMGYNAAGQVTGLTLGNGVAEAYGYDANRLQLTSQTATKSGGPQNGLMNLTYGYQATAGQNGAGTTAGNASQLMTISGTVNAVTESTSYTYDLMGRLATSNQTSNGTSAQRGFSYDRWGNRTGVYDAVSGGNQIQSVVLQQSGGILTNRLTSVTTSGTTANYTYDAAGNVTSDGVHTYTYDAENRVVSVDGGATAQYSYDQNNRRIKKTVGSAVTHYVWEGSQVISEHTSAGATLAEYIYSGSRMIAKVTSGVMRYYLSDRLSERLVLDTSGNVVGRQAHLPFGEDFAESNEQETHHFTSYERDTETGLDYAINRGYAASTGRFNQADPYRASGYMTDPQSWNRYSYTRNDPINWKDATGLNLQSIGNFSMDVSAGGGWISADNPFFAYLWGSLFGGGSGGGSTSGSGGETGSGGAVAPPAKKDPNSEEIKKLRNGYNKDLTDLLAKGDCASKLGPYADQLKKLVGSKSLTVKTFDSNNKKVAKTKIPETGETIGEFFSRCPDCALTRSWGTQRGSKPKKWSHQIVLGTDFFTNPDQQSVIFIHETLHALFPEGSNAGLIAKFNISIPGESQETAITTWLENGCKNQKDDK
jgi:RHS repeat-associated protein